MSLFVHPKVELAINTLCIPALTSLTQLDCSLALPLEIRAGSSASLSLQTQAKNVIYSLLLSCIAAVRSFAC
jgi:hypothetical protein